MLNLENSSFIMKQISKGDERAIRLVVDAYLNKILNLSYRIVYSSDDAEEISQEIFLKLFQQASKWSNKANLATWLYRITINVSINWKRKKKNHLNLDKINQPSRETPDEILFDQVVNIKKLEKAMFQLKESQRIAITLFYFDNLSLKEAALVMKKSEDAYESLLRRGRSKLKIILGGRAGMEETPLAGTDGQAKSALNDFLVKNKEMTL